MSFQNKTFISQWIAAGLLLLAIPNVNASTNAVTNFQDALTKVQQYQAQSELQTQRRKLATLNIQNSRLWQNPVFSIEQNGFDSSQEQELSIGISQLLDVFGQRKINQKIATLSEQQLQLKEQLWKAQGELIVKHVWAQYILSETEKAIFAKQIKASQANVDSAKKRYQAGSIALVDYERAQIEHLDIQRQSQQALLTLQTSQRQLSSLWGETQVSFKIQPKNLVWPSEIGHAVEKNIQQGWLEKLYILNLQQSHQQVELLRVKSRPQPTLNLGMTQTKAPLQDNETTVALGVEIPLNIFNRKQYAIPMAERQQQLLNQIQQRELKQQILDIANRLNELKGLRQQFDAIATQIQLSEKVQSRTLQGFQAGKFSITDMQQTSLLLQNLRVSQLQILKQAWKIGLSIEALSLGTSYEDISQSTAYTQLIKNAFAEMQNLINGQGE